MTGQEIIPPNGSEAQVYREPASLTPFQLLQSAIERGVDGSLIEKLMDLQERHERNQAKKAFDAAMAAAKSEIPTIRKNRHVGFASKRTDGSRTDYDHEDLATIAKVVDPILSKHGLSYRFRTHYAPNEPVSVTCIISHALGHSEENTLPAPPDNSGNKNSIQAIGSTVTYLSRYTLKAALGLAAENNDDDGRAAGGDEPITEEQRDYLLASLSESGVADVERFCAFLRVESLADLPASRFDAAVKAIATKKRKAAK